MKLRDPELLVKWMEERKRSQTQVAAFARVSRQFVHLLATGQRSTCSPRVGKAIEEALDVVEGTLFEQHESPSRGQRVAPKGKDVAA